MNPPSEEGGPVGPIADEETAHPAEQQDAGPSAIMRPAPSIATSAPAEAGDLPPLEELVQRIPAPTRALLDELFRAKFVAVTRLPPEVLKS